MASISEVMRVVVGLDELHGARGEWGLADICAWTNLSRTTVNRALQNAEKLGLVHVTWRDYKGKPARRWQSAKYKSLIANSPF